MTIRLYHHNSEQIEFKARVTAQKDSERGPVLALDQTAFYPTSGGQPFDTGFINEVPVLEVWEAENGEIWHLTEKPITAAQIGAKINWPRRFDHMQQHTGQHLLSAVLYDRLKANTVGFHISAGHSTIDLDIEPPSLEILQQIETEVNQIIWQNHPVRVETIHHQDAAKIPFRKPPQVEGQIRVIWVGEYDASACGGTHVGQTGQIGIIKISHAERYKSGVRLTFLCGQRALSNYQKVLENNKSASASLSIHLDDLPQAIENLQAELSETRRALKKSKRELLDHQAEKLWQTVPDSKTQIREIYAHWEDVAFDDIRLVAANLRERGPAVILLAATSNGQTRLVCTRSPNLTEIHAGTILQRAIQALGGRGGGSPEMAQGGAPAAQSKAIYAALKNALK